MGKFLWRFFLLFCLVSGCIAGYGVDNWIGEQRLGELAQAELERLLEEKEQSNPSVPIEVPEEIPEIRKTENKTEVSDAKEDTPMQNAEGVFFDAESETLVSEALVAEQIVTDQTGQWNELKQNIKDMDGAMADLDAAMQEIEVEKEEVTESLQETNRAMVRLSAVLSEAKEELYPMEEECKTEDSGGINEMSLAERAEEPEPVEAITYPAEIFGQTPVVNRNDEYMTYFEFVLDLMEMVQPKIKAENLNEASLVAKFTVRALVYGVDINRIKINAPIPRSQAALALWIAAQVLEEKGTATTVAQGMAYANDLGASGNAVKKAVAYLYLQGIVQEKKSVGGAFSPDAYLSETDGGLWIAQAKQCWN